MLAAVVSLAGACGDSDETRLSAPGVDTATEPTGPQIPPAKSSSEVIDFIPAPGVSAFVHASDAGVVASISSVTDPRWNSVDGEPWVARPTSGPVPRPWMYRRATVRVEEVLWSSDNLPVGVGDDVVVTLLGSGEPTGAELPGWSIRQDEMSGPVAKGERKLFVLVKTSFYIEGEGLVPAVWPVTHFLGHWTIRGGQAENVRPQRSAPLEPLIERLKQARQRPQDLQDRRGEIDPLEP